MRHSTFHRQNEIKRLHSKLEREGFPRLQMLLIVAITGAAGFLASYWLLRWGVESMALRYPLALAIAYGVFLFLLWLWLHTAASDYTDFPDISGVLPSPDTGAAHCAGEMPLPSGSGMASDGLDALGAADELALPLILVVAGAALLFSSLWVVYTAPMLFAELMVDGVLAASLYRRMRGLHVQHWLATALARTIWPLLLTGLVLCACGKLMQAYCPQARTVGDVMHAVKQEKAD